MHAVIPSLLYLSAACQYHSFTSWEFVQARGSNFPVRYRGVEWETINSLRVRELGEKERSNHTKQEGFGEALLNASRTLTQRVIKDGILMLV
jgi:hypothetical protein